MTEKIQKKKKHFVKKKRLKYLINDRHQTESIDLAGLLMAFKYDTL